MRLIPSTKDNSCINILKICTKIKDKIVLLEQIKDIVGSEISGDYKGLRSGEKIKVFLIGEFSTGKTTYIERFLEGLVGPKSSFPETATVIEHEGGDSELFSIYPNKEYDAKQKSRDFADLLKHYNLRNKYNQSGTSWQCNVNEITVDWDQAKRNGFIEKSNDFSGFIKHIKWTHKTDQGDKKILNYASFYDLPGISGTKEHNTLIKQSLDEIAPDILVCLIGTSQGTLSGNTLKYIYALMQDIYSDNKSKQPIFIWCYQIADNNQVWEEDDNIWFDEWRQHEFSDEEFEDDDIKVLKEEIIKAHPKCKELEHNNDTGFLNRILEIPDFYDQCYTKYGESDETGQEIATLIEKTEKYRKKDENNPSLIKDHYEILKAKQKKNIKALNRLTLEAYYPDYCPKNQSKLAHAIKFYAKKNEQDINITDYLTGSPLIYAMGKKEESDIAKESIAKILGYYFRRAIDNYLAKNKHFVDYTAIPKILEDKNGAEPNKIQNPIQFLKSFFKGFLNPSKDKQDISAEYLKNQISDFLGINKLSTKKIADDNLKYTSETWEKQIISTIDKIIAESNDSYIYNPLSKKYKADMNFFADFDKNLSANKQWIGDIYLAQALSLLIAYHNNTLGKYYLGDIESKIVDMLNEDIIELDEILSGYSDLREYMNAKTDAGK